jgi:hypothetical protein
MILETSINDYTVTKVKGYKVLENSSNEPDKLFILLSSVMRKN